MNPRVEGSKRFLPKKTESANKNVETQIGLVKKYV